MKKLFKKNNDKGFTILFAVLVSILILSVASAIIALSLKQIILSSSTRDSQFAFYAANTGTECAVFWSVNKNNILPNASGSIFATSTASSLLDSSNQNSVICAGRSIFSDPAGDAEGLQVIDSSSNFAKTSFWLTFEDQPYCAYVIVTRRLGTTRIDSYGYNTCDFNNPRRIERGLRLNL